MLAPGVLARSGSLTEQAVLMLYEYTLGSTVCCALNYPGVRPTMSELITLVGGVGGGGFRLALVNGGTKARFDMYGVV